MKLLIIPPTVSEGMVRSNVNLGTRERLTILQQEILSRARLLGVINELGLFRGSGDDEEEMVDKMRRRITMSKNDLEANNTFTLSFYHEDPKVAMTVASRLGSFFIEGEHKKPRSDRKGNLDVSRHPACRKPGCDSSSRRIRSSGTSSSSAASCRSRSRPT